MFTMIPRPTARIASRLQDIFSLDITLDLESTPVESAAPTDAGATLPDSPAADPGGDPNRALYAVQAYLPCNTISGEYRWVTIIDAVPRRDAEDRRYQLEKAFTGTGPMEFDTRTVNTSQENTPEAPLPADARVHRAWRAKLNAAHTGNNQPVMGAP